MRGRRAGPSRKSTGKGKGGKQLTGKVELEWVAPQDPFYGIREENIVPRITRSNWNRKAVLRQDRRGVLYLFVEKIATMERKKRWA